MKKLRKGIAILLCFIMIFTLIPAQNVQAATKISKCKVTLSKTSYNYTGKACKPKVTVKYKKKTLKSGKDYTVTYSNNTNTGTATVTIKGKKNYSGSVKKTFKIKNALTVTLSKTSYTYSGKAIKPSVTVKSGKKKLASKYYSVQYKNNIKVGTAAVIVKGKGKYKGKNAYVTFKIRKNTTTKPTITPASMTLKSGERKYITVKNANGLKISYESLNPSIAGVDRNGEVIGNSAGTTKIKVTVGTYQLYCAVTVTDENGGDNNNDNNPYNNLSSAEFSLRIGDAASISRSGSFANETNITWSSSDTSIITVTPWSSEMDEVSGFGAVNKGEAYIDAVGVGTATIIATSAKGTMGKCDVTVSASGITVIKNADASYESASGVTNGTFTYGQTASSVVNQTGLEISEAGEYNHPSGLACYKSGDTYYFAVTDAWNNRVFVYSGDSVENAVKNTPVVLGQTSATSTTPGYAMDKLSWPMDCAIDSTGRLYIADTRNNRIQVYDDVTGLATGVAANHTIDWFTADTSTHNNHIYWPWSVSTDCDGKLIVTSTTNRSILIWDELPATWDNTDASFYPSQIIQMPVSTTPRTITWTGSQLIIGDENVPGVGAGMYVFNAFPTKENMKAKAESDSNVTYEESNGQAFVEVADGGHVEDFCITGGYGEGTMVNGKLFMAYGSNVHTWTDGIIDSASDEGDFYTSQVREYMDNFNADGGYFVNGGGINKMISVDGNIYMALHNGNKVVTWGADCYDTSSLAAYQASSNPSILIDCSASITHTTAPVTDGKHFMLVDDLDQKISVYKSIPTSDDATPDFVYSTPYTIGDAALHTYTENGVEKTAFIMTSRTHNIIYIWKDFQFTGEKAGAQPDVVLGKHLGNYYFSREMEYVEFDGTYLYISTYVNGKYQVLIYRGLPNKDSKPVGLITGLNTTTEISSNGTYIAVTNKDDATKENNAIWLFEVSKLNDATEENPVELNSDATRRVVSSVNIGVTPTQTNDSDGSEYEGCIQQKFNILDVTINGNPYSKHERTQMWGLSQAIVTSDGKLIASDMQDDRVLIWYDIDGAISGTATPTILGHGENAYDANDTIPGVNAAHDMSEANFADTICMPKSLAYDGCNLWVGEFKFGNRMLRFAATHN